jgi:hypothetical protein
VSREWQGWWCHAGKHIVTDSNVEMTFRKIDEHLTVADCPEHTCP